MKPACYHLTTVNGLLCLCDCEECTLRLSKSCICELCMCDVTDHMEYVGTFTREIDLYLAGRGQ